MADNVKPIVTTRTVHFRLDPALMAYVEWINARGQEFDVHDFDQFAADYRAEEANGLTRIDKPTSEQPAAGDREGE